MAMAMAKYPVRDCEPVSSIDWQPFEIFDPAYGNYLCVFLDRDIRWQPAQLLPAWTKAQLTYTVNQGTHRWVNYLMQRGVNVLNGRNNEFVPAVIFTPIEDWISEPLLMRLAELGSTVIYIHDENPTEFKITLFHIVNTAKHWNIQFKQIYIFSETHHLSENISYNITTLHLCKEQIKDYQVIFVEKHNFMWLLRSGLHEIDVPPRVFACKSKFCLIPFQQTIKNISTKGLKHNLDTAKSPEVKTPLITTYDRCLVTIDTDTPIVVYMAAAISEENLLVSVPNRISFD